jgi:uncharacterized protein
MQPTAPASQAGDVRTATPSDAVESDAAARTISGIDAITTTTSVTDTEPPVELTVDDAEHIKHSPPVLVDEFDPEAGTITLRTFDHRFTKRYREFRVDHCGWESPDRTNLDDSDAPRADPDEHVADREPVSIETGALYMLDPMVDNFGSQKADYALQATTIEHNVLWQHLQAIRQGERPHADAAPVVDPTGIEAFLDRLDDAAECLEPNKGQKSFIRAVERALVPLQGPPGTGKTSGATAPALLGRAYARAQQDESFVGIVVAPSHEAVDAVLEGTTAFLDDWRQTEDGLGNLGLVRILPSSPPAEGDRVDATTDAVEVTYANYHSDDGEQTLQAVADDMCDTAEATQQLLFATPATLYRTLGIIAEQRGEIDDDSAPAAMRYPAGLADVVCIDEASMLDIPQWLLAGSTLKPSGQSLLVGDPRQLSVVSETEWDDLLRKPIEETNAFSSALEYVLQFDQVGGPAAIATTTTAAPAADGSSQQLAPHLSPTDGAGTHQSQLSGFLSSEPTQHNEGDD